jgi:mRNA-degrading endonuclease RelE of RelBE toxin-antitoxin system
METKYSQTFLRDMKKLKQQPIYQQIFALVFTQLPAVNSLREISDIKPITGYPHRYRIRMGNYRIGVQINNKVIEVMRVLHRQEFYRYFP